jgi:hypothetical protein
MSYEFVKRGYNSADLNKACAQQKQLKQLVVSHIQESTSIKYFENFANRDYITDDYLLNFVKTIFKTDNFLSFTKYLRFPLVSSTLVSETVVPELERVFHAEDSYFDYYINGDKIDKDEYNKDEFYQDVFNWLMYRYNDIIVSQPTDDGEFKRYLVSIENVQSINVVCGEIKQIAFTGYVDHEESELDGVIYIDDEYFKFYKEGSEIPIIEVEHNSEYCPCDFVSPIPFGDDRDSVSRYSIFSKVREKLEEYVFMKTLQRMTEPNGAIPTVTKLKTREEGVDDDHKNTDGSDVQMSANLVGGRRNEIGKETAGKGNVLQAGTITEVPMMLKDDGSIDMKAVESFIKFHFLPVESLEYLSNRIKDIEQSILRIVIGDYQEANEAAKNEKQVSKSYVSKQDKLRRVSSMLTKTVTCSEKKAYSLIYGEDSVKIDLFFGSDFFLETKEDIYQMIKASPNPIETKNLLIRLSSINNKFNREKAAREKILYMLQPYCDHTQFVLAVDNQMVSRYVFQLQTRFTYWIDLFEANYGNIYSFWQSMGEAPEAEKIITINNLINNLILQDSYESESEDGAA